ncbi:alpha/beta fold hydrolase [Nocardioides panacisoli]|uniref:alpha/beta fold hydrolase n=1 Tax=Nocardioides panacisoli TaxID=627624 RepID=UPI001C629294|nr:alpha/beta fold hydrolase [Nocardioides panacisoli]QYJ05286.1 alpha/beta fold hydrolase [Nocardioides panacisoli]
MQPPETRYTRAGDVEIAFQTVGGGPVDLVWAFGLMTHLEVKWEEPSLAAMLEELSRFARLILFDRRGCGLSDRGDRHLAPTLEERVEDVVAVLDAVGSHRASIFGVSEGCALAVLFASMYPDRTGRLVLYGGISRLLRDADHPWGLLDAEQYDAAFGPVFRDWGTARGAAAHVRLIAPSAVEDPDYVAWFARQQRLSLSRDAVVRFMDTVTRYDLDEVYPAVQVPTLVLHRSQDSIVPSSSAAHVARRIPGARLVELEGVDHLPYVGDAASVVAAVRDFLGVPRVAAPATRRLVTLLATDAEEPATSALVRRHARRWGGTEVITASGTSAILFDSASRAVRCAAGLAEAAPERGARLVVAVHTAECEVRDGAVAGPASAVPAALLRHGLAGRVVVTGTVRDVLPGSGIAFTDERRVSLPGIVEALVVMTVARPDGRAASSTTPREGMQHVFRLDGEYWTVAFEGRVVTLRDSKGMHDLAALLATPGRERHVIDLWAGTASAAAAGPPDEPGLRVARTAAPILDAEARTRYRRRLLELEDALTLAEERAEPSAHLAEERAWLVHELEAAYGLGGRARSVPDEVERARKAVYRRVADALRRIDRAHPVLGRHLHHAVHTGTYCSYAPERDLHWTTTGDRPG